METFAMDHNRAVNSQACVRYLMREMSPTESSSFEEHYIGCAECSDEVRYGFDAVEAMRQVLAEEPEKEPGFLAGLLASLREPAVGLGLATVVLAGFVVNGQIRIHQLLQPAVFSLPSLKPVPKGSNNGNVIVMPQKENFILPVLLDTRPSSYVSYQATLSSEQPNHDDQKSDKGNSFQKTFFITADEAGKTAEKAGKAIGIRLYSGDINPGSYVLTTFGVKKDGSKEQLDNYYVELQFGK